MRLFRFSLFLACVAILLVACGQTATKPKKLVECTCSQVQAVTVNIFDDYFDPQSIFTPAGETVSVTFINKGSKIHVVEITGLTGETTLQPGGKVTFHLTPQARSYKMVDELYASLGMTGTFVGGNSNSQLPDS